MRVGRAWEAEGEPLSDTLGEKSADVDSVKEGFAEAEIDRSEEKVREK